MKAFSKISSYSKTVLFSVLLWTPFSLVAQEVNYLTPRDNALSSINNFSKGLARVVFSGSNNVTFIDTAGKPKSYIETYDDAGDFHDGLTWVAKVKEGKAMYGFMNKEGDLVIPYLYDEVENFSCNRAAVNSDGVWKIIDQNGNTIMTDSLLITETKVSSNADSVVRMEDTEPPAFHDGLMLVSYDNKYGYADTTGKVIIACQYEKAFDFSDGLALVANKGLVSLPAADSIIKNNSPDGDDADSLLLDQWMVIDTSGKTVYKFLNNQHPDVNMGFSNGLLRFVNDDNLWGVINKYGKIVFPPVYIYPPTGFSDGVIILWKDNSVTLGEPVHLEFADTSGKILATVSLKNNDGWMQDQGFSFSEGLLPIKIDDLWGYMDTSGKIIVKPQFDQAMAFHEGFAAVASADGKVNFIKNPLHN